MITSTRAGEREETRRRIPRLPRVLRNSMEMTAAPSKARTSRARACQAGIRAARFRSKATSWRDASTWAVQSLPGKRRPASASAGLLLPRNSWTEVVPLFGVPVWT
jgi:hypothetical protein